MRTVFFGTPGWAVPSLRALAGGPHRPCLIVTQPARRRGREEEPTGSAVALAGEVLGVPRVEPASARDAELLARLGEARADLFVVVAYGEILPRALLELPPRGCVNVHFSLLPRYRGAAPVQWAIANGDEETGVTTMKIVPRLDAGPIYLKESVAIAPGEHAPELGRRLSEIGARLLVETVDRLERGELVTREQDPAEASVARMLRAEDGWIDWTMTAEAIERRVRAFDPWPGQASRASSGRIKVLDARRAADTETWRAAHFETGRAVDTETGRAGRTEAWTGRARAAELEGAAGGVRRAGEVLGAVKDGCVVACGEGTSIVLLLVRPEGKRAMTGEEALGGRHLRSGEVLGGAASVRS